jgi:Asp-tRNA(Asn)/Glu-tRNA(Gln) amidotransferase C subunit
MNQEEITKGAKKIMDDFMKSLDKIPELKNYGLERETSTRVPKDIQTEKKFREIMFDNAPKVKDDCIQAEKKKW